MTDRARSDPDVAGRLNDWHDREATIDALCECLADAHADWEELRRDNLALTAALRDVCAEKAGLEMRLRHALERERVLCERNRQRDWWGTVAVLWDTLTGRDRWR